MLKGQPGKSDGLKPFKGLPAVITVEDLLAERRAKFVLHVCVERATEWAGSRYGQCCLNVRCLRRRSDAKCAELFPHTLIEHVG